MLSVDSKSIPLIGGTTAALIAALYVLWGPSEKKKPKKKDTCPGLVNLGNTCFLNAILQALAPCSSVTQWLRNFSNGHKRAHNSQYLGYTLRKVLKVLNNGSIEDRDEFCPREVLDALRARRWVISPDEQDAHELFHVLSETLEEESITFPSVIPLFEVASLQEGVTGQYQSLAHARTRGENKLPVLPGRDADNPFRGLLASQLQCKSCLSKYPVKYDTFDSLSLSIPTNFMGSLTLEQMFKHFIMSETVQNVECDGCARRSQPDSDSQLQQPRLKPKTTFIKKLTIGKLPQCLCVHVQRTVWLDNGMPTKRFDHISFPELLHMDKFVYHKRPQPPVSLNLDRELQARLVGGRTGKNGYTQVNPRRLTPTSPTVSMPYSHPVNLLKALNYHSRATTMSGLFVNPHSVSSRTHQSDPPVQRLAEQYSSEVPPLTPATNAYKLTSVLVHLGDVYSGHFITYRRAPSLNGQRFPDKWIYTSDTVVRKASLREVLQANAYMLMYERI